MRISDWSSDVCSSDLAIVRAGREDPGKRLHRALVELDHDGSPVRGRQPFQRRGANGPDRRGETGSQQVGGVPSSSSRTATLPGASRTPAEPRWGTTVRWGPRRQLLTTTPTHPTPEPCPHLTSPTY